MPSAGIRPLASGRFKVYWRLDDGSQGSETFQDEDAAKAYRHRLYVEWEEGTWIDPRRGRITLDEWATHWWATWSSDPERSPNTLVNTESRLDRYVRPRFGNTQLRKISVSVVQRWQNQLKSDVGYPTVMACRSILHRILQAAVEDRRIADNPVARVKPPKKPVDVEARFGRAKRRTFTPDEFGRLLAAVPTFYRDHFLAQVGTGLRPSELLGLRAARVDLTRGHLEVLDVRYDAGKYGSGYKDRPKSTASIRPVPLSPLVVKAVTRRMETGDAPTALVFPGPGGSGRVKYSSGVGMSVGNYRRVFHRALADLNSLPDEGKLLSHLDPHGPHALRATYATWLEDAGIPSRVIDELMGHEGSRPGGESVSRMGALYRETTPEMLARVRAAIDERLTLAEAAAAHLLPEMDNLRRARMPRGRPRRTPQAL